VKLKESRSVVRQRRLSLKLGRSHLTLESHTQVLCDEASEQSLNLARSFTTHAQAWGPLLLQMGQKGLGRALAQMNTRGFVQLVPTWTRQRISGLRIGHHAFVAVGFAVEAWQMVRAIRRCIRHRSTRPAAAQAVRSLTTWGAVWSGVELFGAGGALLGLELGPAVVVTTALGATVGGCVGFFAGDWVAQQIELAPSGV
jgi:hypothetical protein